MVLGSTIKRKGKVKKKRKKNTSTKTSKGVKKKTVGDVSISDVQFPELSEPNGSKNAEDVTSKLNVDCSSPVLLICN